MNINSKKEMQIELELINCLVDNQKYKLIDKISEDFDYFKFLINELERLNCIEFTLEEKEKIKEYIWNWRKTSFDFARLLWNFEEINLNNCKKSEIKFIDFENWSNNHFYIKRQIAVKNNNKKSVFDIVIFINGIPLIIFELKNSSDSNLIENALNDLKLYKETTLKHEIYKFVQILIASNKSEVKIWTNNYDEGTETAFLWNHNKKGDLNQFAEFFLNKENLINYLKNNVILQQENKKIILLRPYQKEAIEKAIAFVDKKLMSNLDSEKNSNNGYIWHATGSGKTITSFKLAQQLSNNKNIDRVVFLLDRRDLSQQTIDEFTKIIGKNLVDLDMFRAPNSKKLLQNLKTEKFNVTTIQKLNKLLSNNKNKKCLEKLSSYKYVFVIDECHRTQAGKMGKRIKRWLKNSIMIGFTGTPIFESNDDSQKTENIFGEKLHVYNMFHAMKDKNVLGFKIMQYFKDELAKENQNDIESDNFIENVVEKIVKNHDRFTKRDNPHSEKKFNAILAVNSLNALFKFYKSFLNTEKVKNDNLFVTAIFSENNDNNLENNSCQEQPKYNNKLSKKEIILLKKEIIKNYNQKFNSGFTDEMFEKFIQRVQNDFKSKEIKIDILIVINMLLTGYDSKITNTLYVSKHLKTHNLIQAFSRTNRICNEKFIGNIVNFTLSEETINESIKIYSNNEYEEIKEYIYGKKFEDWLEITKKVFLYF